MPRVAFPRVAAAPAHPRAEADEIRITWIGHATTLIQLGGVNLLTDPVWSRRASPVRWVGPARFEPPGMPFEALPEIDAVLLTHDHYDHLDRPTIRRLIRTHGPELQWLAPLGHADWLRRQGAHEITQLDWRESGRVVGPSPAAGVEATALPAQHWSRRTTRGTNRRLWCSWAIRAGSRRSVYFTGDSGYCEVFRDIGAGWGPFDASLIPIGAYEPRWFMKPAHMNPEEAVKTYMDLGGTGTFMGIHWGTFRLTDEPLDEPPRRARAAWREAGLPEDDLWIPAFGETRIIRRA